MPKKPPPGKCTYCLNYFENLTWDHILPVSWYPNITPQEIEKWKVPACHECNHRFGIIENKLLLRLGLCLGPEEVLALGISEKVMRSYNPEYAKSDRDRRFRERKRAALLGEIVNSKSLPDHGIFPNFGPLPGIVYDEFHIIYISTEMIEIYIKKLVRGFSVVLDGILLPQDCNIEPYAIYDKDASFLINLFREKGKLYHRGLGFLISRLTREDNRAWIYAFQIWGRLRFYATVSLA